MRGISRRINLPNSGELCASDVMASTVAGLDLLKRGDRNHLLGQLIQSRKLPIDLVVRALAAS